MPRRREVPKREILPDPKYGNVELAKFMNVIMQGGKKAVAERYRKDYGQLGCWSSQGIAAPGGSRDVVGTRPHCTSNDLRSFRARYCVRRNVSKTRVEAADSTASASPTTSTW